MNVEEARSRSARPIRVTTDGAVIKEPCLLSSILLSVADSGDYLDVYDGLDDGGREMFKLVCLANRSVMFNNGTGVLCERGIYASFSADDSEATFFVLPLRESEFVKK